MNASPPRARVSSVAGTAGPRAAPVGRHDAGVQPGALVAEGRARRSSWVGEVPVATSRATDWACWVAAATRPVLGQPADQQGQRDDQRQHDGRGARRHEQGQVAAHAG